MLLEIYHHVLQSVSGRKRVADYLGMNPVAEDVYVIAIGKAAEGMMQGAKDILDNHLVSGVVITKQGYETGVFDHDDTVEIVLSSHPIPDESSLAAGQRLIDYIQSIPRDVHCLFLVSGGTSSLVEVLPEGITLDDLRRVNAWALANGLSIHQINRLRKSLSCIKGGRLASYLGSGHVTQLLISDVEGDDPAVIGSGLLVPDEHMEHLSSLPDWITALLAHTPALPAENAKQFDHIDTHVIARLSDALQAAADMARVRGHTVYLESQPVSGDVAVVAESIMYTVMAGPAGIYIRGGEPTVCLPDKPGRGGRMQALALAAALRIQGREDIQLLAVATDGADGPGDDAGALVDGHTIQRGEFEGLNAVSCLTSADAGTFLEAAGDLIQTGPTGTNVTDLIIALKQ